MTTETETLARQHLAAAELMLRYPDLGPLYMTTTGLGVLNVQVPGNNPDREGAFRRLIDILGADLVTRHQDATTAEGGHVGQVPVHLYLPQQEVAA